ncbi:MAG: hypothetical protein C0596_07705 [Marinilabiliales bacterium]|nr:MAG: hypothetical protein C0596_07705 [Marinilabiliales bacterium]
MKNLESLLIIGIIASALFFTSCDPTDPPVTNNVVEITADITEPTTWTADKVYVISMLDFGVESTLTIEAGTVIKFPSNYKYLSLYGDGKIIANGTTSNQVVFTSYKYDTNGGDTNEDGSSTTAAVGDWGNIDLNGTSGSVFTNCKFLYGGYGTTASSTLNLSASAEATIEGCTFAYNGGGQNGNFFVGALNADQASNNTSITNTTFYNNVLTLTIAAEISTDNSNSFSSGGEGNSYNGIFVSGNIQRNTSWEESEVAYVITSDNMNVGIGIVLTLGNNVILKFVDDATLTLLSGESSLDNYNGSGVYYTSLKDDDLLGDTNGDGTLTAPAIADWTGIFLDEWKSTGYANWSNILYNDPNPSSK